MRQSKLMQEGDNFNIISKRVPYNYKQWHVGLSSSEFRIIYNLLMKLAFFIDNLCGRQHIVINQQLYPSTNLRPYVSCYNKWTILILGILFILAARVIYFVVVNL